MGIVGRIGPHGKEPLRSEDSTGAKPRSDEALQVEFMYDTFSSTLYVNAKDMERVISEFVAKANNIDELKEELALFNAVVADFLNKHGGS